MAVCSFLFHRKGTSGGPLVNPRDTNTASLIPAVPRQGPSELELKR